MHSGLLSYLDESGNLFVRVSLACKGSPGSAQLKFWGLCFMVRWNSLVWTCEEEVKIEGCIERGCCTPQVPSYEIIRKNGLLVH